MKLSEFSERLDRFFDLRSCAERDGWDFALSPENKQSLLTYASPVFRDTFNGLLTVGNIDPEIARVYLLVFPQDELLRRVLELEAEHEQPGAVIVTHHPVDMETFGRGFLPIDVNLLGRVMDADIAIYVLHAPLDSHLEISTSGAIADGLGLQRLQTFAPYVGGDCGVIGEQAPQSFDEFAGRVQTLCELPWFRADALRFAGRDVSRVAIVAGGGDDPAYIAQAEALGCDTYLAGHWWTPHPGEWSDQNRAALRGALAGSLMNFLSASHDGSELVVFRDRLDPLFTSWGLDAILVRQQDHWR